LGSPQLRDRRRDRGGRRAAPSPIDDLGEAIGNGRVQRLAYSPSPCCTPLRYDIEFPSHAEVFAIVQFPCDDMFG
jgi:hypothetical protein